MKFKKGNRKSDDAPRWWASDSKNLFTADGNLSREEVETAVLKGQFLYDGLTSTDGKRVLSYSPNAESFDIDISKGIKVIDSSTKEDFKITFTKE